MSIIRITPDNFNRYTLLTNPRRTFVSSSESAANVLDAGITGTISLLPDGSPRIKDVYSDTSINASSSDDSSVETSRMYAGLRIKTPGGLVGYQQTLAYMNEVNQLPKSEMFNKRQSVIRFVPGARENPDFYRKKCIQNVLFPYYRSSYPSLQYTYTNYHSLNFVTCSLLPSSSALIYPAGTGTVALQDTAFYAPSSSFTFDFYINPRYAEEIPGSEYKPGTIFHMSSSFAISLVTGSSMGADGRKDGYRMLLQLSQSAEIPPSELKIDGNSVTAPFSDADQGFLFVSSDNSLKRNTWHHVAIRWGGSDIQKGTGSFVIDNVEKGVFNILSESVMAPIQTAPNQHDADALFIGNFYEGSNFNQEPIAGFFNPTAATEYGTVSFNADVLERDPEDYHLRHPLNAEVHDLKIFNNYRVGDQIYSSSVAGFAFDPYFARSGVTGSNPYLSGSSAEEGLLFYVPPLFTKVSPKRYVNQTPFFYATGSTEDPFNVAMSFGIGGHELNLENFTREFVRGFYPRALGFEPSRVDTTTSEALTANQFIYASGSNRKRNLLVLPCDNGRFVPNFNMLLTQSFTTAKDGSFLDRFKNDFGSLDLSVIDLREMVSTASLPKFTDVSTLSGDIEGNIIAPLIGATPEDPAVSPGNILTILQRTHDPSSNEVVFFDISNIFYGDKIKPQSVVLKDLSVTGSAGRVQITLKDDGRGNLYRADSEGKHAQWASVGNVIYEEGLILVKSPNIPMFGEDAWEITFEGQRNIHVLELNVLADKGLINSSSNPTFKKLMPTDTPSETASEFVYLTGLQLHDDNLNVIGRANLAQPVVKREGDRYTIRLRMDF